MKRSYFDMAPVASITDSAGHRVLLRDPQNGGVIVEASDSANYHVFVDLPAHDAVAMRDALTHLINAPRDAARITAEAIAEDDGVRLLKTTTGEWGVVENDRDPEDDADSWHDPDWHADEAAARRMFAELRGKVVCDCGAEVDDDDAIDNGDGYHCPACATAAAEEFARTRYRCVATDDGINGTCGWEGLGPELTRPDGETIHCPTCAGDVEEAEIIDAAPEAKP